MIHMNEVHTLFAERTRVSAIAKETRIPVGTVWSWKKSGSIPRWRRTQVLEAVQRLEWKVPIEVVSYLAKGA